MRASAPSLNFSNELKLIAESNPTHPVYVIGVDEAGRGPIAGPVVAAAFCFKSQCEGKTGIDEPLEGVWKEIADSKVIPEDDREKIYDRVIQQEITEQTINESDRQVVFDSAIGDVEEIDTINILQSTLNCMSRAVFKVIKKLISLSPQDSHRFKFIVLVDGNREPPFLNTSLLSLPPKDIVGDDTINFWDRIYKIMNKTIVKGDSYILSIASASIIAKVTRDRIMRELHERYPCYNLIEHKGYPTPSHKEIVKKIGPCRIHRLSFEPCYTLLKNNSSLIPEERDFNKIEAYKNRSKKRKCPADRKDEGGQQRATKKKKK